MVSDGTETVPVGTALKNLAKLHDLPPFDRLYSSGRRTVLAVTKLDACLWRAALSLPPFDADGITEGFWMGGLVKLVKLSPQPE
jgi:hypothetical protein